MLFASKVLDDCPGNLDSWYRHISKGAWPFSTADHGWPISDCTAEGLKVIIGFQSLKIFCFKPLILISIKVLMVWGWLGFVYWASAYLLTIRLCF